MIEQYARDFEKQTGRKIELMDIDGVEGSQFAENRDIMVTPAMVIVSDDGGVAKQWLGTQLPLFDQVLGYLR